MNDLIYITVTLLLCFIVRLAMFLITSKSTKQKKKIKFKNLPLELAYVVGKFKLKSEKLNKISIYIIISLLDATIISLTAFFVTSITNKIWLQMCIGLIILVILIYIAYEMLGKILKKKGYDKNE